MTSSTTHAAEEALGPGFLGSRSEGAAATTAWWFVKLRWIAFALLGLFYVFSRLGDIAMPVALVWIVGLGAGVNLLWLGWLRRGRHSIQLQITAQSVVDAVLLAALIHYSGGIDNPLQLFFVSLVAIVSVVLPRRHALVVAAAVVLAHGGTIVSEATGVLPHNPLPLGEHALHDLAGDALWQQPEFIVAYLVAFSVTVFGVVMLVGRLVSRLEESTRLRLEHRRIALARTRLARIGTLSSGVAHAIRNPIHGMLNCLEMLESNAERDPEDQELLGLLREGLTRIESITGRLLRMSREAPLSKVEVDLTQIVKETVSLASLRAREGVDIISVLQPLPKVRLDPDRFIEALANVIDNALDASQPGSSVDVHARRAESGAIELSVIDRGEGIEEALLEKVVDPFFSTKAIGEGSGLGLAITSEVVEEHGFELSISSEVGRGTTVSISIPVPTTAAHVY